MSERRPLSTRRPPLLERRRWLRAGLFGLALAAALFVVLAFQFLPSAYQVSEGEVSRHNIKSPQRVVYVSQLRTKEERDRAAAVVPEQFVQDASIAAAAQQQVADTLRRISEVRQDTATLEQKRANLQKIAGLALAPTIVIEILGLDEQSWRAVAGDAARIVEVTTRNPIYPQQLADLKAQLAGVVDGDLDAKHTAVATALTRGFIRANMRVDSEATERARQAAREAVPPVRLTIEEGEMILREGDIVKSADLEKLRVAGLHTAALRWTDITGIVVLVGLLSALLSVYVYLFNPDLLFSERRALLLIFLIVSVTLAARLVIPGRELYAYVFPLATVPMLVAALLDPRLALAVTVVIAPLFAQIGGRSLELATLALAGGVVGLVGAWRVERFNRLFLTGLGIAVATYLVLLGFQLPSGELTLARAATLAMVSLANGALCGALALGNLSLLGHIFGITTTIGLLELAHPSQPLFRRLLTDAPGTYHHSVIVANLAERAAHQIGADAMLARVGAYYHDIGKVVHPFHFIENQMDGTNIHDRLEPHSSAGLVIAHVKDGLALARRHGLPSKVRDIIGQHHGTGFASFFFARARDSRDAPLDASAFRYPGPRPQTAEAALIMLADSVEATVRASRDHSPEQIDQLVQQAINDRLAEGQLNECDLTLRDLELTHDAFVTVLQGIFHPRLEYPETRRVPSPLRLLERVREDARSRLRGGGG